MNHRLRVAIACGAIVAMFVAVQLGALALVEPFQEAGLQPVEDPDDPTLTLVYVAAILVLTGVILVAFRHGYGEVFRALVVLFGAYVAIIVFDVLAPSVFVGGVDVVPWLAAIAIAGGLWFYPEWYVVDAGALVMGIGAAGLFGITFGILPAILLLVVLAVYDAISVYGTEHMLTLASGVMDLRMPIVFVVPTTLSYSYLRDDLGESPGDDGRDETAGASEREDGDARVPEDGAPARDPEAEDGMDQTPGPDAASGTDRTSDPDVEGGADRAPDLADREALFIGLGDAVVPAVLVASVGFFLEDVPAIGLGGLSIPLPAGTAIVGTVVGLAILLGMVLKGRAHAGLPLLNGGTIAGYLVGALASGLTVGQALGLEAWL